MRSRANAANSPIPTCCSTCRRHSNFDTDETRSYDDAGRLASVEIHMLPQSNASHMPCAWVITTTQYDAQGRLSSTERKPSAGHDCSEGVPYLTNRYSYAADGGIRIEPIDYGTDTPNDTLTIDGQEHWVGHDIEMRTAGCQQIGAQIGAEPDPGCKLP